MSDTANGFVSMQGDAPVFLTVGPLASGLVLATVRIHLNLNAPHLVSIGAVLTKNLSPAADNFAAGNSIIERSADSGAGKPAITFFLATATIHELILVPRIRLVTRPAFLAFRFVHDGENAVGRYFVEAMTLDTDEVRAIEQLGRIIQTIAPPGQPIPSAQPVSA